MKYILIILMVIFISCKEKKKEFTQPEILKEGSSFDLTKLTFNEDILKLLSKSLDTINNDYSIKEYEKAVYIKNEDIESLSSDKQYTYLDEKRYHFKTLELDSIAQFLGLSSNRIEFETDSNLKIQACWATAKVYDTLILDKALYKMYANGNVIWNEDYEFGTVLTPVSYVYYDENENTTQKTKYEPSETGYEHSLYYYKYSQFDNYSHWELKNKIIQIKVSNEVDFEINLNTGKFESKNYYNVEFLICTRKEYELMKVKLILTSTKNNYPMQILKPYYIKDLDFYLNFSQYYRGEDKKGKKKYKFY